MKIPTRRLDLGEIGYDGYWVEGPRSVKESFQKELESYRVPGARGRVLTPEEITKQRTGNLVLLDRLTGWNLDDDAGKPLPLTRSINAGQFEDDPPETNAPQTAEQKALTARLAVLGEVPLEVIAFVASKIVAGDAMMEKQQGF